MEKHNIIFIALDGLRRDRISLMPEFSKICEKNVFFSNMITVAPYTISSMASAFTGLYPSTHGINSHYGMFRFKKNKCKTLTQYFKDLNYYTCADMLDDCVMPNQGFDKIAIHNPRDNLIAVHKNIISQASKENQFFLYFQYTTLHDEYMVHVKKFPNDLKGFEDYQKNKEENTKKYNEGVIGCDEYIKEIMSHLEKLDLLKNTIVIFFSDHGTSNGEKSVEKLYGDCVYDFTLKVFCTIVFPELQKTKIEYQTRTIDIAPTVLDIFKIAQDENYNKIQGRSLMPFIEGKENGDRIAFCETGGLFGNYPSRYKHNVFCIRYKNKKLIYNATPRTWEFYDLEKDSKEESNLIYTGVQYKEDIEKYKKLLVEKIQGDGKKVPLGQQKEKKGFILLFSGLSGSGKTVIANKLMEYFKQKDIPIFLLDGDVTRAFFDGNLGFDEQSRYESGRRLSFGAHILSRTGTNVIITCTMGTPEIRKSIRDKIDFIEIFMDADIQDCIKNDSKGLYKKTIDLKEGTLRGINLPFIPPKDPDFVLRPYKESVEESFQRLVEFLEDRGFVN